MTYERIYEDIYEEYHFFDSDPTFNGWVKYRMHSLTQT